MAMVDIAIGRKSDQLIFLCGMEVLCVLCSVIYVCTVEDVKLIFSKLVQCTVQKSNKSQC